MKEKLQLKFNEKSNSYEISFDGFVWVNDGTKAYVTVYEKNGKRTKEKNIPLSSAEAVKTEYQKNKIITRYDGFYLSGKKLPFTLICTAEIVDADSVVFSFKSENETEYEVGCYYKEAQASTLSLRKARQLTYRFHFVGCRVVTTGDVLYRIRMMYNGDCLYRWYFAKDTKIGYSSLFGFVLPIEYENYQCVGSYDYYEIATEDIDLEEADEDEFETLD